MLTVSQLAGTIGRTGTIRANDLVVTVRVDDVRTNFGRVEYSVTPIAGDGHIWIDAARFVEVHHVA